MQIKVEYAAQVKAAAGTRSCVVEVPDDAGVEDVVRQVAAGGSDDLRRLLINEQGAVEMSLLLFVGSECVAQRGGHRLQDGDTVAIVPPISGG